MEWIKDLSDKVILWLLHLTGGFGNQLTPKGRREQEIWRERRLRNLKGLAIRSRQRLNAGKVSAQQDE